MADEEIEEAIRIAKQDKIIRQGAESRAALAELTQRYNADRESDNERWSKWEESQKPTPTPENDPTPNPEVPPAPPEVPPAKSPEEGGKVKEKKKRGLWFGGEDES